MWNGFLAMGGLEIFNSPRSVAYTRGTDCPTWWLTDPDPCYTLEEALGGPEYTFDRISEAPWYDVREPASARFYGAYVVDIQNLNDSTREAEVTQRINAGGVVGAVRDASRRVRATVWLSAKGSDALEVGMDWLKATTRTDACGLHGGACGETDLEFLVTCPPDRADYEDEDTWRDAVNDNRRFLHTVTCISGPITQQDSVSTDGVFHGRLVQMIFEAGTPWVFTRTKELILPPSISVVMEDAPINLMPFPSAELAGPAVVVGRNLSPNPSVEVNANDWNWSSAAVTGATPAPYILAGRSADISADGAASYRVRLLGNASTGAVANADAQLDIFQNVSLAGVAAASRMSFNIWGAVLVLGGAAGSSVDALRARLEWRNGTTLLRTDQMGSAPVSDFDGFAFSTTSLTIPPGASTVRVIVQTDVSWSSSAAGANNSDIRFYGDAIAVTVP